jgi:glycosyltransferase involved in cell wall biosynthesis
MTSFKIKTSPMFNKKIFILLPAETPDGPIKGAYALANALIENIHVTVVTLKRGSGVEAPLDPRIEKICLASKGNIIRRLLFYRCLLYDEGGRVSCYSLSICFSADFINSFCRRVSKTMTSIRGNLIENYRHDYGLGGILLAFFHLFITRFFDQCIAMTWPMAKQISSIGAQKSVVIGNFIDETHLAAYHHKTQLENLLRFVFVGSLKTRKQPLLVIRALNELLERGLNIHLDIVGEGPLLDAIRQYVSQHKLKDRITIHGQLKDPYPIVRLADAMILPSLSEGISRAVLEALFLGVPCVVRQVDGNAELIKPGFNGILFSSDCELAEAMWEAGNLGKRLGKAGSLLPVSFRQKICAVQYLDAMENILDRL